MTGTGMARPARPWLAACTCGHQERSGTHAGAVVLGEAHRATTRKQPNPGEHTIRVVNRPEEQAR